MHPAELMVLLEHAWNLRRNDPPPAAPGEPFHRSDVLGLAAGLPALATPPAAAAAVPGTSTAMVTALNNMLHTFGNGVGWDHLIYAYMIENTRIFEIFRRVVHEFLHGEKLGAPGSPDSQMWLRSTEELFYRDPPPFTITSVSSQIRADLRGSRRNAYQRMFGMELNHGADDNTPYRYTRGAGNDEFVATFEELLREVWIAHTNVLTTVANPTDLAKITELVQKLHGMLLSRRVNGNMSREEFFFVAMMSWFHLTVETNLPFGVMVDLRSQSVNAEQRLFTVARAVGLPAHGLSRSYFEIAQPISQVLSLIETGALNGVGAAQALYDPAIGGNLVNDMNTISSHWSVITGHDMKARKVATA
jgi:hypothetical protein